MSSGVKLLDARGQATTSRRDEEVVRMTEIHGSSTALSAGAAAHSEGGPAGEPDLPRPPEAATRRRGWTPGRITALVIGALIGLFSLVLLGAGGTAVWAYGTQRDAGYVTTDVHEFSTAGSALVTVPTDLGAAGTDWLYSPSLLDQVRIRVTPASSGSTLFVGIGPTADVDRYLAGVSHTVINDFWSESVQPVGDGTTASAPGTQEFWVASDTGPGARTLTWDPAGGSRSVVVMNADGRPGVDVSADLGATIPALLGIGVGVLIAGGVFLIGAVLLIVGAIRRTRRT
jgi:hypothetical protein